MPEGGHDGVFGAGGWVVMDRVGWVYFMTNRPDGVLYVGVTADLVRRVYEHREGLVEGFTRRYELKRLVYFERFEGIVDAIAREKVIKEWRRAYKVRLIVAGNPGWDDLYDSIV
jgi:putative endonuclease